MLILILGTILTFINAFVGFDCLIEGIQNKKYKNLIIGILFYILYGVMLFSTILDNDDIIVFAITFFLVGPIFIISILKGKNTKTTKISKNISEFLNKRIIPISILLLAINAYILIFTFII